MEQALNSDVEIDIETTPPSDMEASIASDEETEESKEKENEKESQEEEKDKEDKDEEVNLDGFPEAINKDILIDAVYEAMYQNPMVMTVDAIGYDYEENNLIVQYGQTADEQEEKQQEVAKVVKKVVSEIIKDDMTDIEKEFAINEYLIDTAEYDNAELEHAMENDMMITDDKLNDSFTPYGVLVNKVGVCASYASAFKLLADAADLESIVVTGNLNGNLPHAWNRVKIDDEWISVDSTNNDIEQYPNALLNLPDEVSKTVLVEDDKYILDERIGDFTAKSDKSEFYKVEENFFDEDKVVDEIVEQIKKNGKAVVRTSYNLTESEAVEIINKAGEKGGFKVTDAYTWLGVISVDGK
ncbi:MAG: transglutaminase domain-containing protein [Sarcina sp.]